VLLSTAWLPRLVAAFEDGTEQLHRAARRPVELVLALSAPICAITIALAEPLVQLLYGDAYAEAVPVTVVLGLCIPPMYLSIIMGYVLVAARRQVAATWIMAGAAAFNPLVNVFLIRLTERRYDNGAIGAASSLLLTEVLMAAVALMLIGWKLFDRQSVRRCVVAAAASAVMCAAAYAARPLGLVPAVAVATAVFVALALPLRLVTRGELDVVRSALRRSELT
jgi:O-antigen/teichoic acid export membrane protein